MEKILSCPYCGNVSLKINSKYKTKNNGERKLYKCELCKRLFSETRSTAMFQINTEISKIASCIRLRSEGLGQRATARILGIHKNTVKDWEIRFSKLKDTLKLYFFCHKFIELVFEGDEVYTKVGKNKRADDSEGWTIILMDRASRYILESKCGKKEEKLFKEVINQLIKVAERTKDVSLFTDGERRYSKILFELCNQKIIGKGKPKKVLKQGIRVRLKNKGSKKPKKYEAPVPEYPNNKCINEKQIHANHVEAKNSALRRTNSAFKRKANTYAKSVQDLQRTLDVDFIVHNYLKPNYTTKIVPAVALKIIPRPYSIYELLMMQRLT